MNFQIINVKNYDIDAILTVFVLYQAHGLLDNGNQDGTYSLIINIEILLAKIQNSLLWTGL